MLVPNPRPPDPFASFPTLSPPVRVSPLFCQVHRLFPEAIDKVRGVGEVGESTFPSALVSLAYVLPSSVPAQELSRTPPTFPPSSARARLRPLRGAAAVAPVGHLVQGPPRAAAGLHPRAGVDRVRCPAGHPGPLAGGQERARGGPAARRPRLHGTLAPPLPYRPAIFTIFLTPLVSCTALVCTVPSPRPFLTELSSLCSVRRYEPGGRTR